MPLKGLLFPFPPAMSKGPKAPPASTGAYHSCGSDEHDSPDQFWFEQDVRSMCLELILKFGSVKDVKEHYQKPGGEFNQLIKAICFAQKMHREDPYLAEILARVRCVAMTVKARFLRSEQNGDFVRQPNAKWYVKPAMGDYDPRLLVPMQAKIAEYIRGECTNPDSTEDRTVQLNQLDDLLDVGSTAAEGLSHASQVLFEGYAVLTDLAVQVSFSRVAEKTHSRFNGKNPDLNPDNA